MKETQDDYFLELQIILTINYQKLSAQVHILIIRLWTFLYWMLLKIEGTYDIYKKMIR